MRQLNLNKAKSDATSSAGGDQVSGVFQKIQGLITDELVQSVKAVFQFKLSGDKNAEWYLDLKNGTGMLRPKTLMLWWLFKNWTQTLFYNTALTTLENFCPLVALICQDGISFLLHIALFFVGTVIFLWFNYLR